MNKINNNSNDCQYDHKSLNKQTIEKQQLNRLESLFYQCSIKARGVDSGFLNKIEYEASNRRMNKRNLRINHLKIHNESNQIDIDKIIIEGHE